MDRSDAKPRQRREQTRAIETRERIIDAATAEFAQNGFEGASLRKVAQKAKARHTAITYYFDGKEGLWQAVFDKRLHELLIRREKRLEGLRGVDDTTKLKILFEDFIRHSAKDLELHKLMTQAAAGSGPEFDPHIAEYLRGSRDLTLPLIRAAQEAGAFIKGDPDHMNYLFIGAATRIFMQAKEVESVTGRSPFSDEFIEQHVEAVLNLFFIQPPTKGNAKTG